MPLNPCPQNRLQTDLQSLTLEDWPFGTDLPTLWVAKAKGKQLQLTQLEPKQEGRPLADKPKESRQPGGNSVASGFPCTEPSSNC